LHEVAFLDAINDAVGRRDDAAIEPVVHDFVAYMLGPTEEMPSKQ